MVELEKNEEIEGNGWGSGPYLYAMKRGCLSEYKLIGLGQLVRMWEHGLDGFCDSLIR